MKKFILSVAVFCAFIVAVSAQNYTREGNVFSASTEHKQSSSDEKTPFIWKDPKGNAYDIYITKNNACYVIRISKKTGNEYRYYLPKEMSAEIAKELNRPVNEK